MRRHPSSRFVRAALLTAFMASSPQDLRAAGDKAFGEYLSSECVTCHQPSGRSEGIPAITGWPEAVFIAVLMEYRSKVRVNQVMQTIAGRLSDGDIAALAAYFGALKSPTAK